MNRRGWFVGLIPVGFLLTPMAFAGAGPAGGVPQYHLAVGQELVYSYHYVDKYVASGQIRFEERGSSHFQVVATAPGGGWHVIEETYEGSGADGEQRPQQMICFDLMPDGKFTMDPRMQMRTNPSDCFPRLPSSAQETAAGWSAGKDQFGEEERFKLGSATTRPAAGDFAFAGIRTGPMEDLYQANTATTYRLDPQRGLLTSATLHCDVPSDKAVEDGTNQLQSSVRHSPGWADAFGAQARTVMDAIDRYDKAMDDADTADDANDNRMSGNLRILQDARGQVSEPLLLAQLALKIDRHSGYIQEIKDDAAQEKIVGKPAPPWDLPDLSGMHHSLADLRGQVVVIDFWYRGCGWCMRAMPAVKQLAEDYRGKPVAFFGMNVDADDKDAQFVADYFKLPYATLRTRFAPHSGDPTTKPADEQVPAATYHVQGYPTLFIIGPDGVIRQMHMGYSPTMHDELAKQIDALLPAKAISSAAP